MTFQRQITKSEWLKFNGFSEDGVTYLVLGNSYLIKNTLKENNFKFTPLLRWHADNCNFELPKECKYVELHFDTIFIWDMESNTVFMKEGARQYLEDIFNPKIESTSNYVGEIGEKIKDIEMLVHTISGFNSAYGYKWVYTFEDEDENLYTWFTTVQQPISSGQMVSLTGTIKAHVEYKGVRTTQLTRCKIVHL